MIFSSKRRLGERKRIFVTKLKYSERAVRNPDYIHQRNEGLIYIPGILFIVKLNIFPFSFMSDSSAVFITIRHKSGLDRHVSASSTILLQDLSSRLSPFCRLRPFRCLRPFCRLLPFCL